jgi:hypothetical protein
MADTEYALGRAVSRNGDQLTTILIFHVAMTFVCDLIANHYIGYFQKMSSFSRQKHRYPVGFGRVDESLSRNWRFYTGHTHSNPPKKTA